MCSIQPALRASRPSWRREADAACDLVDRNDLPSRTHPGASLNVAGAFALVGPPCRVRGGRRRQSAYQLTDVVERELNLCIRRSAQVFEQRIVLGHDLMMAVGQE
jgi:hypothetical protein